MKKWAAETTKYHCGRVQFSRDYDILTDKMMTRMLIMFNGYYIWGEINHTRDVPATRWPLMLRDLNYQVDSVLYRLTFPAVC